MSRLYDRMRAKGKLAPPSWVRGDQEALWESEQRTSLASFFGSDPPVFVIDNVAEYLFAGTDQETWIWSRDFPCCRSPFPSYWIEYKHPKVVVSSVHGTQRYDELYAVGMIMQVIPHEKVPSDMRGLGPFNPTDEVLAAIPFIEPMKGGTPHGPAALWLWRMNEAGAILQAGISLPYLDPALLSEVQRERVCGRYMKQIDALAFPVMLALSFMNCRNTTRIEHTPPEKLSKRFQRDHKTKEGLTRYHTVNIEPMRKILKREGGSDVVGLQRALHICRGGFAYYEPEKPLFGKISGQIWRPSHVRGSLKAGKVEKDYNVKAPRRK